MVFEEDKVPTDELIEQNNLKKQEQEHTTEINKKRIAQIELISTIVTEINKPIVENLKEHGSKLTALDESVRFLVGKMNEIVVMVDNHTAIIKGQPIESEAGPITDNPQMNGLMKIADLANNPIVDKILNRLWPAQQAQPAQSLIDPEIINQHIQKSIMGNFEVGEAIIDGLKDKLTRKAMNKLVSEAIHEPE